MIFWETFKKENPEGYAIALDGYVREITTEDYSGPWLNLNHHQGCVRSITDSTCMQIKKKIEENLFKNVFVRDGLPYATLFFEDCDADCSFSKWAAENHERIRNGAGPLINRIFSAENELDVKAGFSREVPLDSQRMRELAWICEPYNSVVREVPKMNAQAMTNVMESIGKRLDLYVLGKGEEIALDTRYNTMLNDPDKLIMFEEIGFYARTKLLESGVPFYIAYRGEYPKGKHRLVIGVHPEIPVGDEFIKLTKEFNEMEGIAETAEDKWGGGDRIIGPPRAGGTSISPEIIFRKTLETISSSIKIRR